MSELIKNNLLKFNILEIKACVGLENIDKVILLPMLTPVTQSPSYLAGLANIAGKSIPIIDLALLLGMSRDEQYSVDTPIILCFSNEYCAGLIVDKVIGTEYVESELQKVESFSNSESVFSGMIKITDDLFSYLDVNRVLELSSSGKDTVEIANEPK